MLELHSRAAYVANEAGVHWYHLLLSRFVGDLHKGTTIAVTLTSAIRQSEEQAEVRGMLEQSVRGALPVVLDLAGSINLETRELVLADAKGNRYDGEFSENGRVVTLRKHGSANAFHLVHEATLKHLIPE